MKKLLIILVLSAFGFSGCGGLFISPKKKPFYCKVDGKKFVPEKADRFGGVPPLRVNFYQDSGALWINALNLSEGINLYIIFPDKEVVVGEYELSDSQNSSRGTYSPYYSDSQMTYNSISGKVKITDFTDFKITGTFEFIGMNAITGKLVKVTNGNINTYIKQYYD